MLVENVNGESKAASMLKDSEFYIEVAKFVQAYTTIVNNPNEFLGEIQEPLINEEEDKLSWEQFVNIVQKCDLGFKEIPTSTDLVVFYNYALEIGTINPQEKRLASVDDVADAQKHYYNFVDEAKDRAEAEYLRQRRVTEMRERESAVVDNKISLFKTANYLCVVMMMFACVIGVLGVVSFLFENELASAIGSIFGFWNERYVGAIVLIVIGVILFALFDKLFIKTRKSFLQLKMASSTIFNRTDETYLIEQTLKRKLNAIRKDFKIVQAELKDKTKKYDVKHNIEVLKGSNKFYQKLCENEYSISETQEKEALANAGGDEQEFAPIKLSKEQEENLRAVSKEAIKLEGQFDVDAYNEKFEKSTKKEKEADKEEEKESEVQQEQQEEEELLESIDFIKSVLGFAGEQQNENQQEK